MATFIEALLPSEHDTLSLREALGKIAQCERLIKTQGACSIVDNFNIIYSCYCHIKDLKEETLNEIISILLRGLQILETELRKVLSERLANDERVKYLNTLKIFIFLTIEFTNFLEKKNTSAKDNDLLPLAAKKGAKKTASKKATNAALDISLAESSSSYDWNDTREKVLDCLSKIVLLNIQKLWDPPIAEEQFVICITNLCYKLMENCQNNSLRPQQKKVLKEHLCHILGIMIKKYNHSYAACVMIIQTLPHYEHLSSVYADLIQTCVVQLGYESILPEILREFRHTIQSGASVTAVQTKDKENPNNKFYSQFLIDLVDRLAPHLVPYFSLIQDLLDDESYLMRNSILYIYGEIVCRVLNQSATNDDLKLKQMRNELLDTLIEHMHDCNALTRSRVMQIWRKISEEKAIPLHYVNELMKRCIGRMEDVASSVRKSAFQLLCDLIRKNPYGIKCIEMSDDEIRTELAKEQEILAKLNQESDRIIHEINRLSELNASKAQEMETDGDCDDDDDNGNNRQLDIEIQEKRDKQQELVIVQTSKVNYLKDMLSFVNQIQNAIPKISRLLFSKTQTDVLEVISFFVTCYEHGFTDMIVGIRKMLVLVFNAEKTIRDAVVSAYKRLYLNVNNDAESDSTLSSVKIAKQLLKLVKDLSICERDALEELIGECAASNELDNSVIKILWEFLATAEQSPQNRLNSIILLGMIIKRVPAKGRANIQVLIDYGLALPADNSSVTDYDLLRVKETCQALSNITSEASTKHLTQIDPNHAQENQKHQKSNSRKNRDNKENEGAPNETSSNFGTTSQAKLQYTVEPYKLLNNHQLFERITDIIVTQFTNLTPTKWVSMVESALHCIIKLADNPLDIFESIINQLIDKTPFFKLANKQVANTNSDENQVQTQENGSNSESAYIVNSDLLARFYNFIAIVATKVLIFLNQIVICELKRRKMYKENIEKTGSNKSKKDSSRRRSLKPKHSRKSIYNEGAGANLEEEMGLQGAEAEDAESILVESLLEQKVSKFGKSLLANFVPSAVQILKEPSKYPENSVQLACSMCLIRCMNLSQSLCNEHLQLIFTLLKKSPNPMIRSQLILGIGDLVYRFPNALEPWTNHLYLPLRDTKSVEVRMNTIRVLSHLILKEMIKTRGQMYEIALCTNDSEPQISALAKLFFSELSNRNNGLIIYNAMPDMISQLSGGGGGGGGGNTNSTNKDDHLNAREISEESFRSIATFLFGFIKRDKQCETLIEKLCQAFRQSNNSERKCRDLAFCLSKIQLSENCIKKLKETFKFYADKLTIPYVYDTFKQTILKNARKLPNLKNEVKLQIDELEKQIDDVRQKGLNDDMAVGPSDTTTNKNQDENMEQDEDEEQDALPASTQRQAKNVRQSTARSKPTATMKTSIQVKKEVAKKNNASRARRKVADTSSSEQENESSESDIDETDSD